MSEISKSGEDLIERQITAAQIREDNIDPVNGPLLKSVNNIRQYDFDTNKDRVFTPLGNGHGYVQIAEVEPELVTTSNIGTNISIPFPKHMDSNGLNEYYANVGKHGKKVAEEVRDTVVTGVSKGVDMFTDMASDFLGKYIQVKFDPNMFDGKSMPEINPKQILMDSVGFEGLDLSAFEPETLMGQYTSDIAAYIVAGTLTPGGPGGLASKALIKDVGALLSTGPELGNIFTAMEALGLENEIVSFFNAYMENPDNASADERLASRIKATIDAPLFAAALFVAAKTLGNRAFQLATGTVATTGITVQEADAMGSGPLATFVKNSLKQGVKQVDNLPQPGAVNQVNDTVYQRNDKGDLVPQPKIDPQDNIARIEAPTDNEPGIIAFHGSGADFDEFRLDKIGSGEGAQVYGYGLYFTEVEDIAKYYRKASSYINTVFYKGKNLKQGENITFEDSMAYLIGQQTTEKDRLRMVNNQIASEVASINELKNSGPWPADPNLIVFRGLPYDKTKLASILDEFEKRLQTFENIKQNISEFKIESKGKTYKVELAAKPEELLDYDLPFSDQSAYVKKALRKHKDAMLSDSDVRTILTNLQDGYTDLPGAEIVDALKQIDGTGERASKYLNQLGIKGIKYRASGSRNPNIDTDDVKDNFVIFDDAAINILAKYGIVGPVAVTALSKPEPTKNEQ